MCKVDQDKLKQSENVIKQKLKQRKARSIKNPA